MAESPNPSIPGAPLNGAALGTASVRSGADVFDQIEIHSIPDKFYGAALRAKIANATKPEETHPDSAGAGKRSLLLPIIIGAVLLLGVGGGFAYFNRALLFPAPAPTPEPTPTPEPPAPPPEPPLKPTNVSATATSPTVIRLSWTDAATDEAKYRVDRRESATSYATIRNLAPNEIAYDDPSVEAEKDYLYRIVAVNDNGEGISDEVTVRTPALPPPPPEQVKLPPAGLDSDSDGLTDLEEPLYGSPPRDPDADKDSFNDGNEVFHLYSPSGRAPGRLLESGLVKAFESSVGWRVYAPASWQTSLTADGLKGTIMTGHGENFVLSVEDNAENRPLLDWYLAQNPGVLSSQVTSIQTKSGYEGIEGVDQLTAYFVWGSKILVFRYDLDNQPFVNFRTTFEMMKNSLSLKTVPVTAQDATPVAATTPETPVPQEQPAPQAEQPEPTPQQPTPQVPERLRTEPETPGPVLPIERALEASRP